MTKKTKSVAQAYDEATVQETNAQTVQENNTKSIRIIFSFFFLFFFKKMGLARSH